MIKGRVRLDFCDAITGKVKDRVEGDNAFTSAIDSLLNKCPCGADRFSLDGTKAVSEPMLDFTKTALGGVVMFPDEVTSGTDTLYEPLNHQPTAYARYGAQDTTDMKTGFFSGESGHIANGYQFVYEWGAAYGLANSGYIKTVCLTNKYGGEAYGKKSFFGDKWMYLMPSLGTNINIRPLGWCDGFFYYLPDDYDEFDAGNRIKKISRPLYEMLVDQPEMLDANGTEVPFPTISTGDSRVGLDPVGKKIYIMSGAAGTTKTLTTIDLTNETSTQSTLTFASSISAKRSNYIGIVKRGNYLYFCKEYNSGSAVISKINLNNNADYDEISVSTATANGDLFLMTDTNEINGTGFIIGTDDTVYETTGDSRGEYMVMDRYGVWQPIKMIGSTGAGTNMIGFQINPYYMATKFVLSERKQKTSALTMKLIYEVTHV